MPFSAPGGRGTGRGTLLHRPSFAQADLSVKVTCHKEKIKFCGKLQRMKTGVPIWDAFDNEQSVGGTVATATG